MEEIQTLLTIASATIDSCNRIVLSVRLSSNPAGQPLSVDYGTSDPASPAAPGTATVKITGAQWPSGQQILEFKIQGVCSDSISYCTTVYSSQLRIDSDNGGTYTVEVDYSGCPSVDNQPPMSAASATIDVSIPPLLLTLVQPTLSICPPAYNQSTGMMLFGWVFQIPDPTQATPSFCRDFKQGYAYPRIYTRVYPVGSPPDFAPSGNRLVIYDSGSKCGVQANPPWTQSGYITIPGQSFLALGENQIWTFDIQWPGESDIYGNPITDQGLWPAVTQDQLDQWDAALLPIPLRTYNFSVASIFSILQQPVIPTP